MWDRRLIHIRLILMPTIRMPIATRTIMDTRMPTRIRMDMDTEVTHTLGMGGAGATSVMSIESIASSGVNIAATGVKRSKFDRGE